MSDYAWNAKWNQMIRAGKVERPRDARQQKTPVQVRQISSLNEMNEVGAVKRGGLLLSRSR